MVWNPLDPDCWAKSLGLAAVPMVGGGDAEAGLETIWVMLDGKRASFSLSIPTDRTQQGFEDKELNWSWSAYVRHALRVDAASKSVIVARWDVPGHISRLAWPAAERMASDIILLLQSLETPRGPDCVSYVLEIFRSLRGRLGYADAGVSLATLNCLLLALRQFRKTGIWPAADGEKLTPARLLTWLLDICPLDAAHIDAKDRLLESKIDIKDVLDDLARPEPITGRVLFPHILLRHASSYLYQEAHLEIERDSQLFLFNELASAVTVPHSGPRDARYTPPNLARALARESLKAVNDLTIPLVVLDPACGSGVFLQEFVREALNFAETSLAKLIGYDISPLAKAIAPFATQVTREECGDTDIPIEFKSQDSLDIDWEPAHVIVMNPPFCSWQDMSPEVQAKVRNVLGGVGGGRPDLAAAFLWKACQIVKPGGVVACVLPAPLLQSTSLKDVRAALGSDLTVTLLGRFHGYSYFASSLVETSFVVLKKSTPSSVAITRILVASEHNEDDAIRRLRGSDGMSESVGKGGFVEYFAVPQGLITSESWLPRRQADYELLTRLQQSELPTVEKLFVIHQGVRTGHNEAFLLSAKDLATLPKAEQAYFRPAAGQGGIVDGKLSAKEYIFYPFAPSGPLFDDEKKMQRKLPKYFRGWLEPHRPALELRAKISAWWLPTWPRVWQFERRRKIVTSYFGGRGSYSLDLTGDHAVVSGFAWFWRRDEENASDQLEEESFWDLTAFGYLALLNSSVFDRVVECVSWSLQGGQKRLEPRFMNRAYIPDLLAPDTSPDVVGSLAELGAAVIERGLRSVQKEIDVVSERAYGIFY